MSVFGNAIGNGINVRVPNIVFFPRYEYARGRRNITLEACDCATQRVAGAIASSLEADELPRNALP